MTVSEIICEWLKANGYDGLWNENEPCGCNIDDLDACGGPMGECRPAYKHINGEGDDVHCSVKKITDIEDGHCIGCEMECPVEMIDSALSRADQSTALTLLQQFKGLRMVCLKYTAGVMCDECVLKFDNCNMSGSIPVTIDEVEVRVK